MFVLSIETATRGGSLAVLRDGENLCAEWRGADDFSHSSGLLPEIEQVLHRAGIELKDISLMATAIGPGSFTGLRVGLATVKGLATARKIPSVGVPTLAAMIGEQTANELFCPIIAAGRSEIFGQLFQIHKNKQIQSVNQLQTGKLSDVLTNLATEPQLNFIVAPSFQAEINDFAASRNLSGWKIHQPPENLAVCVGKTAWCEFQSGTANEILGLIYGRGADIGKPKTA